MRVGLVWFRRDLRLADNAALRAALDACDRVVPVFIHAPNEEKPWQPGGASRWWLHHSLTALDEGLKKHGTRLHVRRGASLRTLGALIGETGAEAVFWNRLYDPAIVARDRKIKAALLEHGVEAHSFGGALLFEPWELATGQGTPCKVFTPYWRQARAKLELRPPSSAPRNIKSAHLAGGLTIDALALLPKIRWDDGLRHAWRPGETGARATLRKFLRAAIVDYPKRRDFPAESGTSRLSPYLHFGEITPMQIAWAIEEASHRHASAKRRESSEAYVRQLGWREFSHHLLYHFPKSAGANLNPKFDRFDWAPRSPAQVEHWRRGMTGIPIVDAGLRELWATGWMHNRVRMLVASFLTKNLRQHWLEGARWFWDTLVDADLANNTQGWQWTAGTGADAAPYFRIFNPVTQGERFDPDGNYVRAWVPELHAFKGKSIHRPWDDGGKFAASGYPEPIVDLATTREAALAAYAACK